MVSIGGLGSLRGPFVAALLIGVADTACKYWIPEFGAFFIYFATIAVLLVAPRGAVREGSMKLRPADMPPIHASGRSSGCPGWSRSLCYFAAPTYLPLGSYVLTMILFALSLDLILGYGGIVTLGHSAYFGTGAYVAGILAARLTGEPLMWPPRGNGCRRAARSADGDRHPAHARPRAAHAHARHCVPLL